MLCGTSQLGGVLYEPPFFHPAACLSSPVKDQPVCTYPAYVYALPLTDRKFEVCKASCGGGRFHFSAVEGVACLRADLPKGGRGRLHNQPRSDMEVLDMFRIISTLDFSLAISPKLCTFLTSTDATSKG